MKKVLYTIFVKPHVKFDHLLDTAKGARLRFVLFLSILIVPLLYACGMHPGFLYVFAYVLIIGIWRMLYIVISRALGIIHS